MLRVHHINCGTMCPLGGRFMDGFSKGLSSVLCCHCLLVETDRGLVLVDTGFGVEDIAHPHARLSEVFLNLNRIQLDRSKTALAHVERMGFKPEDVRHIVVTHLDFDHAGGLTDFPNAKVHLLQSELDAARNPKSFLDKRRYRHQQWDAEKNWRTYKAGGEGWYGFEAVRDLGGLPPEILLIPLIGHTWGHAGVAIQTENGWLLHAGDAYFYRGEMNPNRYECTPGLGAYQTMMEVDRRSRLRNQGRLRQLIQRHEDVQVFSAHDVVEFDRFAEAHAPSAMEIRPDLVFV